MEDQTMGYGPSMMAGGAWLGIFGGAAVEWYLNLAGLA
jgi:hypothetical protein